MNIFNEDIKRTEKGFIDKYTILKYVSEADIFELVFRFKPREYDYVVSPFREDKNPGCWFENSISGKLTFVDFGSQIYQGNTKMIRIDCFDAVQKFYKIGNLYNTLLFIRKHLIEGKNLEQREVKQFVVKQKDDIDILINSRSFNLEDKAYWFDRYQITKQNLIEDKVFPIIKYKVLNSKKFGDYAVTVRDLTYCYTDFESGRKKIHRPNETGKKRFITNCTQNDIGGIRFLPLTGKNLIITKSLKDYRVLRNQGCNVIYFQNEGMFPTLDILLPLCNRFKYVTVFFDNDQAGIEAAIKLVSIINSYIPGKASYTHFPIELLVLKEITDPSDFIYKEGRTQLIQFLNKNKLL